jgi:hypothetical protein
MKPQKYCCNQPTSPKISDPLMRRLAAYSATAGAALLAAPVADATIQNIDSISLSLDLPQNGGYQSLSFDAGPFHGYFNGSRNANDRVNYFPGTYYHPPTSTRPGYFDPGHSTTVAYRYGRASLAGYIAGGYYASRMDKGIPFAGLSFAGGSHLLASRSYYGSAFGNFMGQSGYLAFQTGSYYGWLKVKVGLDADGVPNQLLLVDNGSGIYGAFDKIDDAQADGFTVGAVAVPEPSLMAIGGLGLLAFGAAGVRELRRRRGQIKK